MSDVPASPELPPPEQCQSFLEQVSLPVNSWPFIRQFVHDMMQRMNWPPLMLPLLKPDSDVPDADRDESEAFNASEGEEE